MFDSICPLTFSSGKKINCFVIKMMVSNREIAGPGVQRFPIVVLMISVSGNLQVFKH